MPGCWLRRLFRLFRKTPEARSSRPCPWLEPLEDRCVPSVLNVGASQTYSTIQAAINAAKAGDTIRVHSGTYAEQLTITKNNLTLTTTGPDATIQAPASFSGPSRAIIDINGATGVVINDFIITAGSNGPAVIDAGIQIEGGGSARITKNHITHIQDGVAANLGNPDGVGILIGRSGQSAAGGLTSGPTTGRAVIKDNRIDNYQKDGIVVTNSGSRAEIEDNVIVGVGSNPANPGGASGVEISFGATGEIEDNYITGNLNPVNQTSADVLLFQAGRGVEVEDNYLSGADVGVWLLDTSWAELEDNVVTGTTQFGIALDTLGGGSNNNEVRDNAVFGNFGDGIDLFGSAANRVSDNRSVCNAGNGFMLDLGSTNNTLSHNVGCDNGGSGMLVNDSASTGNRITDNVFTRNGGADVVDHSQGVGTAGTGNFYDDHRVGSSSPTGLNDSDHSKPCDR
jgi:parallel beta-helix repeat protein